MSDTNNQTPAANPGAVTNVPAAEGAQNVASTQNNVSHALTLDEINALTGHKYDSVEKAKDGLKELTSFVGKKIEAATPEEVKQLRKSLEETNFYLEHPDLKDFKGLLSKFSSPAEAINDPEVKKAIDAMKNVEADKNKSVLTTNSRINAPQLEEAPKKLQSALESVAAGKTADWVDVLKAKGIDMGV